MLLGPRETKPPHSPWTSRAGAHKPPQSHTTSPLDTPCSMSTPSEEPVADGNRAVLPPSRKWLLPFHRAILQRVIPPADDEESRDGLVILAPGLGLRRIVSMLLRAYSSRQNLVLLLNASPRDVRGINEDLSVLGLPPHSLKQVHHEMGAKQR